MSKVSIRPLGEKVLVQRLEAEDKTAGGIFLPAAASPRGPASNIVWPDLGIHSGPFHPRIEPGISP